MCILSIGSIIYLFFRPKSDLKPRIKKSAETQIVISHLLEAALPKIQHLWEEGDKFIKKDGLSCPQEIIFDKKVGRSYFQCQPHFWQCFWEGGVQKDNFLKIEMHGEVYHLRARSNFPKIQSYSDSPRFYKIVKGPLKGMNFHYGVMVDVFFDEFPDKTLSLILTDTCRDTFLPENIYAHVFQEKKSQERVFLWDNFNRKIFIDKFYVSNQMVNDWRLQIGEKEKIIADRLKWPLPAIISRREQVAYCSFWGKRVLEAELFHAASMTPIDLKDPLNSWTNIPQTPWQRDLSKTFLGMARINPDYQLTPLDCQLAQVEGCNEKFYATDSVSWMGMNYSLGFYPEVLKNNLEPKNNLKLSSRFRSAESEVHELGYLTQWQENSSSELPVAFRCYEEVSL
jgi:hypothetical protein